MNNTQSKNKESEAVKDLRKAIGGKFVTVSFNEDAEGNLPAPQELFIKSLTVKTSDLVIKCIDDEMALAAIFTGKTPEWLDTLDPNSFNSVIEEGRDVNTNFFDYCAEKMNRRRDLQAKFMPEIKEREKEMMKAATEAMQAKMRELKISPSSAPV